MTFHQRILLLLTTEKRVKVNRHLEFINDTCTIETHSARRQITLHSETNFHTLASFTSHKLYTTADLCFEHRPTRVVIIVIKWPTNLGAQLPKSNLLATPSAKSGSQRPKTLPPTNSHKFITQAAWFPVMAEFHIWMLWPGREVRGVCDWHEMQERLCFIYLIEWRGFCISVINDVIMDMNMYDVCTKIMDNIFKLAQKSLPYVFHCNFAYEWNTFVLFLIVIIFGHKCISI